MGLTTAPCGVPLRVALYFQISSAEQVGNQPHEAAIMDVLRQNRQQDLVVDAVEAAGEVALDEPRRSTPCIRNLAQRCVATPIRSEAVGAVGELRLVVGLQDHPDDLLQQFVRPGRNAERSYLPVRLGNVCPSDWRPTIPLAAKCFD